MMDSREIKPGDYVKLRGRIPEGIVAKISKAEWVSVDWSPFKQKGPQFVHIKEIEIKTPPRAAEDTDE